jgi:UDP-N-acetylglucosamine 1-carboxyvinyltransferase
MSTFIVEGGKKLHGAITVGAGKNSPIAILCATLLVHGKVTFKTMPHISEVEGVLTLLKSIGVVYEWHGKDTLTVDTTGPLTLETIDQKICAKLRVSLLLLGALAHREKKYKLYKSGGCRLGNRTVRPHLHALSKYGVQVESLATHYAVTNEPLKAADVVMSEAGDTATENAILGAVLAPGTSTIRFASANYMVQDLCHFLVAAGAKIDGIGTSTLTIRGVKALKPVKEYVFMPDPVDAMAWISLAVATKSELTIKNCAYDFLTLELEQLSIMGQTFTLSRMRKYGTGKFTVCDITIHSVATLKALPDKLHAIPYPGINADNIPLFVPILTRARGSTLIHDWMFENRAIYYVELQKLGANVMLLDPHRALVTGPTALVGNEIVCPPGIRPGMAILIAMIAAKGKSVLRNANPVERAYEDVVGRLQSIGVTITREV